MSENLQPISSAIYFVKAGDEEVRVEFGAIMDEKSIAVANVIEHLINESQAFVNGFMDDSNSDKDWGEKVKSEMDLIMQDVITAAESRGIITICHPAKNKPTL